MRPKRLTVKKGKRKSKTIQQRDEDDVKKDVACTLMRPNENKMSDGGRERASLGMKGWKSSQKWSVQRSAVGSIAWLRLSKKWDCMVFLLARCAASLLRDSMPRFKPYDYRQDLMVPLKLEAQLPEGSLEYALHHLIEERVPDAWFETLYANDEIGRPAYSPRLLLKVILLGYARGIIGSRRLERACQENMTFLALACGIRPDHSTLAAFVGKLQGRIELIFSEVLLVCHEEGLLSGTHLSLDGVKLPGNASRESSGTFEQLRFKAAKLRRKVAEQMAEHRRQDRLDRKRGDRTAQERAEEKERRARQKARLLAEAQRLERFVAEEEPKEGARGQEVQSNVTDNESAKMTTSHGVMQGYNAQALVDGRRKSSCTGGPAGWARTTPRSGRSWKERAKSWS